MLEVKSEPKAVTVARAHAEALYKGDNNKMRSLLADDVRYTVLNTVPNFPGLNNAGVDNFMHDVMGAPPSAFIPGSVKIIQSIGDDERALLVLTFESTMTTNGTKSKFVAARHYLIDENGKVKTEQVIIFPLAR
jgi:ketosteroid isomerase-like protein